jgi:hypothetical protein
MHLSSNPKLLCVTVIKTTRLNIMSFPVKEINNLRQLLDRNIGLYLNVGQTFEFLYYTVAQPVGDLGSSAIVSIKIESMKEKDQCVFGFHETGSPWVVLQHDGALPHWGLPVRQFLNAKFPKR